MNTTNMRKHLLVSKEMLSQSFFQNSKLSFNFPCFILYIQSFLHCHTWGIARGFNLTRNYKIYVLRLLAIAVASQIPYFFLFKNGFLNICFTLLAGLIALRLYDSSSPSWIRWTGITLIALSSQYLNFEYGFYGVMTILFFHLFWGKETVIYYQASLTLVCTLLFRYDPIQLVAALSPIFILMLQSKDYKLHKALQYGFYPAHLLLLIVLKNGGLL